MNFKNPVKKSLCGLLVAVLAFLISSLLLFGLMQTDWGRRETARIIERMVSEGDQNAVVIKGLKGRFPFDFQVGHLSWSDKEGPWLEAQGVTVRWSAWDLRHGILRIETLRASSLNLERLPKKEAEAIGPSTWPPAWLTALGKVRAEDLVVERFSLGERVLGEAAVFRAEGRMKSLPREQEASVSGIRLDGKGTSLGVHARLRDGRLSLNVNAKDEGDLLARVLGLHGPLSLSLQGEGELDHWEGSMIARADAYGELSSAVILKGERDVMVSAAGSLRLRPDNVPTGLSPWIEGKTPFALEAVVAGGILRVQRLTLNREDAALTLSGALDLRSGNTDGRFDLFCADLSHLAGILHGPVEGTLSVAGSFSGMITSPALSTEIKIQDLVLRDSNLSSLEGRLRLTFADQAQGGPLRVRVQGNGDLRDLKAGSFQEEQALWVLDLTGPLEKKITIDQLEFRGKSLSLLAAGDLEIEEPVSLALHLRGKWALPLSFSPLKPFLGQDVAYEGKAVLKEGELLSVSEAVLKTSTATLTGNGTYGLRENILHASWDLAVPDLRVFAPALRYDGQGSARFTGTTGGPLQRLHFKAQGRGKDLLVRGLCVETAEIHLLAYGTPMESQGEIFLSVAQGGQIVKSRADFVWDHEKILFPRFTLEGPETSLGGRLEVQTGTGRLSGRMHGECRDLSALSPWTGEKIQGKALLDADFVLGGTDTDAALSLDLEAGALSASYGRAGGVRIKAQVTEPMSAPSGRLSLEVKEARLGGLSLSSSTLEVDGDLADARFQAFSESRGRDPFFELQGSGSFSFRRRSMRWEALKGFYRKTSLTLASPLYVEFLPEKYSLRDLALRYGSGLIKGAGQMEKGSLDFFLEARGLALEDIPSSLVSSLSGSFSGELTLRGTPAEPVAGLKIRASGLKADQKSLKGLPPLILEGNGDFRDRRIAANISIKGLTAQPFEARLALPLDFSLSPLNVSVPSNESYEGFLTGEADLASLSGLLGLEEQTLGGQGIVDLRFGGTVEAPALAGHIRVNDGAYENFRTGTILRRGQILISASAPRLQILEARAEDGEKGEISAQGWLDIVPEQGFPLNVALHLDQARVFRYDEAVAMMSGNLSLKGPLRETELSGRITVDSSDFRIPGRLPESITDVEVIEINKREDAAPAAKLPDKKDFPWPLNLDVLLESHGRSFVRGRGLDSEWQGQIKVSGKASKPSVTGSVSVVRGKADFLGKTFDVKEGTLSFGGNFPPSPFIDVFAEAASKDITARLTIAGILPSFDLKLSSQPPLPEDEILARLLFGRSAGNLSPIQALQLADALNTLSGGGMDLMGRSRRLLGVDQLAIKSTGEKLEDSALAAGKYISENVYIEVEKGISPETGKASVKWDVTPNVTVDTEVGVNAEAGVGVQWKWDY